MQKKTRNIIFILTLLVFVIAAPLLLLLAQGMRIEFREQKIQRTGGLYVNVLQKQAEIYLDNALQTKTSLLSNSALIKNLLPKKYKIEIKKEGYFPWQKTLEIKEGEVISAINILLNKKNPQFEILKENVENFPALENDRKNQKDNFFLEGNNLYQIPNLLDGKKEIFLSDVVWFEIIGENLYWISNSGFILKSNLKGTERKVLNKTPLPLTKDRKYEIKIGLNELFIFTSDGLYMAAENGELKKIINELAGFELSPDLQKVSFWKEHEIWILEKEKGEWEKVFLTRFSESPQNVFWLTPYYLIFNVGDEIKITEIDNRDELNMVTLITFKNPKIFFNQGDKKLYILSENSLFCSEELIP